MARVLKRWQDKIVPVVAEVVQRVGLTDPVALRVALRDAYPFEQRTGYPYRAWLAEIDRKIGGMRPRKPDPTQRCLFDEDEKNKDEETKR